MRSTFEQTGALFVDDDRRADGIAPKAPCRCIDGCTKGDHSTAFWDKYWSKSWVQPRLTMMAHDLHAGKTSDFEMPDPKANYPNAIADHVEAFRRFPVAGKRVLVAGSETPWVEIVLRSMGAQEVFTSEYRLSPVRARANITQHVAVSQLPSLGHFDVVVSFSSVEHDGLGRYCDPINPNGDQRAVREFHGVLKPNGLLFLGLPAPIGGGNASVICGNGHRLYSRERLLSITRGFEWVDTIETHYKAFAGSEWVLPFLGTNNNRHRQTVHDWSWQPIFILTKVQRGVDRSTPPQRIGAGRPDG